MAEYMDPAMDAMEDAAGTAAEEAYTAAMESGADPQLQPLLQLKQLVL